MVTVVAIIKLSHLVASKNKKTAVINTRSSQWPPFTPYGGYQEELLTLEQIHSMIFILPGCISRRCFLVKLEVDSPGGKDRLVVSVVVSGGWSSSRQSSPVFVLHLSANILYLSVANDEASFGKLGGPLVLLLVVSHNHPLSPWKSIWQVPSLQLARPFLSYSSYLRYLLLQD